MEQIKLENIAAAGFRFLAFLLDGFICLMLSFSVGIICGSLIPNMADTYILFNISLSSIIQTAAVCAYFVLLTYFTNGATLGKLCVGIRVVSKSEERLSFITVLYRETVGRFLNSILFIGYFLVLFDSYRRSAADFLSDTLVVSNMFLIQQKLQKMNIARQLITEQPLTQQTIIKNSNVQYTPVKTAEDPWQMPDGFTGKM